MINLIKEHPDVLAALFAGLGIFIATILGIIIRWLVSNILTMRDELKKVIVDSESASTSLSSLKDHAERNDMEYTKILDEVWDSIQSVKIDNNNIQSSFTQFKKDSDHIASEFKHLRDSTEFLARDLNNSMNEIKIEIMNKKEVNKRGRKYP